MNSKLLIIDSILKESNNKPTSSQISYALHLLKLYGKDKDITEKQVESMNSKEIDILISELKEKRTKEFGKPMWYGDGSFRGWRKK